ncbi:ATP-binding cassette domain-containing protein [Microbispora sp. KK1-11]|nr:ATP-binding cassette domain-containing protein [Microbispora sp. KK1-11]
MSRRFQPGVRQPRPLLPGLSEGDERGERHRGDPPLPAQRARRHGDRGRRAHRDRRAAGGEPHRVPRVRDGHHRGPDDGHDVGAPAGHGAERGPRHPRGALQPGVARPGRPHPLSLSGGEQQRLVIAAARLSARRIVVFDEPSSGVDRRHLHSITQITRDLAAEGVVILLISHDDELITLAADQELKLRLINEA